MGMNNRDYMSPEATKKIYNLFNQIYRTGNPTKNVTYEIIRKDGVHGFHEMSASLMKDQAGQPIGFRGIAHDITEFKKAEDALRETKDDLDKAQQLTHLGNWSRDLNFNRAKWSDETYRIFGLTPGDPAEPTFETGVRLILRSKLGKMAVNEKCPELLPAIA
jgi:PAS domain-containing protein